MAYTTIDDPSAHFQADLYTGAGNNSSVTFDGNSDLQLDWLWVKRRDSTDNSKVFDTSRGIGSGSEPYLTTVSTEEEQTYAYLTSVNSDGFTWDTVDSSTGTSSNTYVAWGWKANGGSLTTNDASATGVGTIDSQYQVNSTAGFSIVTHTGSGSAGNIAHGLGAVPEWVLTKNRITAASWANYHVGAGAEYYLELDTSDAREAGSSVWGDTTPSSTTFRVGGANTKTNSGSGDTFVSYCFTPIQGYSKFDSYIGNGNADGPFVYTGFKPVWLMIKNITDASRDWIIITSQVQGHNPNDDFLRANTNGAEVSNDSGARIDFLSNGFKIRGNNSTINDNSDTHIYMTFAEHPFVSSKGVPVTAK
tara:strand:+ start:1436 stop:2521 length:1086 start_codon:yes stop_codon:yes gene_type:complete